MIRHGTYEHDAKIVGPSSESIDALGVNTPIEMEGLFFTFLGAGENRLYERTPNVRPVAAVLELLPTNRDLIASGQG